MCMFIYVIEKALYIQSVCHYLHIQQLAEIATVTFLQAKSSSLRVLYAHPSLSLLDVEVAFTHDNTHSTTKQFTQTEPQSFK